MCKTNSEFEMDRIVTVCVNNWLFDFVPNVLSIGNVVNIL